MTSLYELNSTYKALQDREELTGEDLTKILQDTEDIFTRKVLQLGRWILSLQAESEAVKVEIDRLANRKQALDNKVKSIKSYLVTAMQDCEMPRIKDNVLTVNLQNSPPSVVVLDATKVPPEFFRVIPEQREIDKNSILIQYKATGEKVEGTDIVVNKHIVIR